MNTAIPKGNTSPDTTTYGQQHHKLLEELTFVEDSYLNLHCLELDFSSQQEQDSFFSIHESQLPNHSQISCCIKNTLFKEADFLVITKKENEIDYQIYITFKRQEWHSDLSLDNFCGILRSKLNQQGLTCKLEMSELFGVYMSITQSFAIEEIIQNQVEQLSQTVLAQQNSILQYCDTCKISSNC